MNNPLDRIQSYYGDLTKTDREIAIYIINNPRDIVTVGIDDIAKTIGVSKSAVSRFAKRIGYNGYVDFRYELAQYLVAGVGSDTEQMEKDPKVKICSTYADYINRIPEAVSTEQVNHIADLFLSAKRAQILGVNRSYNSANQLKQRLARIGLHVTSEGDGVVIRDNFASFTEEDLVIIFTTTDNSKTFAPLFKEFPNSKAHFVTVTCNPALPFKNRCEEFVVLPRISKDSYAAFLDDQAIFMVFSEVLIEAIAYKYNKRDEK